MPHTLSFPSRKEANPTALGFQGPLTSRPRGKSGSKEQHLPEEDGPWEGKQALQTHMRGQSWVTGLGVHSRASSHKPETIFSENGLWGLFLEGLLYFPNSSTKKKKRRGESGWTPLTRMKYLETNKMKTL